MQQPFILRLLFAGFAETIGDFLLFPFWWYSKGLVRMTKGMGSAIAERERQLALGLWVKNLFKPMYGQADWQGKLISFIFRVLVLLWRSALFCVWVLFMIAFLLLYIFLPIITVYGLLHAYERIL